MFEQAALAKARESNSLRANGHACCAVYLAGYVVECNLKALLAKQGKSFPRSGRGGHDLTALWNAAGFRARDLSGHRRQFIDYWSTALRYESVLPGGHDADNLLDGATQLASFVVRKLRNTSTRGARK